MGKGDPFDGGDLKYEQTLYYVRNLLCYIK